MKKLLLILIIGGWIWFACHMYFSIPAWPTDYAAELESPPIDWYNWQYFKLILVVDGLVVFLSLLTAPAGSSVNLGLLLWGLILACFLHPQLLALLVLGLFFLGFLLSGNKKIGISSY